MEYLLPAAGRMASTLEEAVLGSFGVLGLDRVLTDKGGRLLITNNGSAILNTISISPGLGTLLIQSAQARSRAAGDGASSLVLMVAAALRQAVTEVGVPGTAAYTSQIRQRQLALAHSLGVLKGSLLPCLFEEELQSRAVSVPLANWTELDAAMAALLHTAVAGKMGRRAGKQVVGMTRELIRKSARGKGALLCQVLEELRRSPPLICVPGGALSDSAVLDGLLLEGAFLSRQTRKRLDNCRFLLFSCSLDSLMSNGGAKVTVGIASSAEYASALTWNEHRVDALVAEASKRKVSLVLSTDKVSDFAVHCCQEQGIAVVQLLPDEDAATIARITRVTPLTNCSRTTLATAQVGVFTSAVELVLGGKRYLHFTFSDDPPSESTSPSSQAPVQEPLDKPPNCETTAVCTLLLRAPSEGLCKQYCNRVVRGLALLQSALSPSSSSKERKFQLVPGAGAIEVAVELALVKMEQQLLTGSMTESTSDASPAFGTTNLCSIQLVKSSPGSCHGEPTPEPTSGEKHGVEVIKDGRVTVGAQAMALRVVRALVGAIPRALARSATTGENSAKVQQAIFKQMHELRKVHGQEGPSCRAGLVVPAAACGSTCKCLQEQLGIDLPVFEHCSWSFVVDDPMKWGVVESLPSKLALLLEALDVTSQLLRLDGILSTRRS